jgi:hypothetical protein
LAVAIGRRTFSRRSELEKNSGANRFPATALAAVANELKQD